MKFIVRGTPVDEDGIENILGKASPRVRADPDPKHLGFAAVGYAPGRIKDAESAAAVRVANWRRKTPAELATALADGEREPKPFDLSTFLRDNRPTRIERPKSTAAIAQELAQLAVKAGWEYVRVEELITNQQ